MNIDKVEELAKKIYGVKITKNPLERPMYEFTGTELAMFTELIVGEMLQTCEDHPAWTGRMIGEQIKQHFGVEE